MSYSRIEKFVIFTAAEWAASTLILHTYEGGLESDTGKMKHGNGLDVFSALTYIPGIGGGGGGDMLAANNLSDVADIQTSRLNIFPSLVGNGGKFLRANPGETDFDLVTLAGGGDMVGANNLTDVVDPAASLANIGGISDISGFTTTDLAEGTNLYFTNARAVTALTGQNVSLFVNDAGYLTSETPQDLNDVLTTGNTTGGQDIVVSAGDTISVPRDGLLIGDLDASHHLLISYETDLTNDRTLTIFTGDASRVLTLAGNATISGTNTGDQTSIVGITGTKAEFDTACSDGNFLFVGDITQYTDEMAQDAVGGMVDTTLVYVDGTPLLTRAALTGAITASQGSNTTALGSFTKAELDTAVSDGNVLFVGDITQYTDEMAQDAVGGMVDSSLVYTDGTPLLQRAALTGDVTASAGSNTLTIANDAVTFAKFQNITDARLLGRSAGSDGDMMHITVGTGLTLSAGSLTASGVTQVKWNVFTATGAGTYTPTSGMKYCTVYVTGGGGASLDCTGTDAVTGGGGAGGTAIKTYTAATIGASKGYVVGAGGTRGTVQTQGTASSFHSSDIVGNGGFSSAAELAGATTNVGYGGTGGTATGGDMNINGGSGTAGIIVNTTLGVGGTGGASFWGGGRCAVGSDTAGLSGQAYGSGSAGAHAAGATDRLGANGADGVVVIVEYI